MLSLVYLILVSKSSFLDDFCEFYRKSIDYSIGQKVTHVIEKCNNFPNTNILPVNCIIEEFRG